MDILVVGTGNIGTLYGWALAEAGHTVTHLVRPGADRPVAATLDVLDERSGREVRRHETYAWRVTDVPPAAADVVLVASAASSVRPAVAELAPRYPSATFVTWALEWDAVELGDLVDPDRLVVGYPDSGGTRTPDGQYVLSLGAHPHLGVRAGTAPGAALDAVVAVLADAGLAPERHEPFEPWLWVHVALTIPYMAALRRSRDLDVFVRDRGLLRSAFRASHEILRLCEARGADLASIDDVATARMPAWLFPFAFRLLYRTNEGMRRAAAHGVQSIDEGLALAEQVLRAAEAFAIPVPELRALLDHAPAGTPEQRPAVAGPTLP
jgi:2-dehydropantoate 2-reductase